MNNIKNTWAENANSRSKKDDLTFHRWFDNGETMHEIIANGSIDFYHRIFTQDVYDVIGDPRNKTCIEIGFGGGRLLRPALEVFDQVYGIDISNVETFQRVEDFLNRFVHNENRYHLFHQNDVSNIESNIINFVYSFIVFQHFHSLNEVEFYFSLLDRIVKKTTVIGKICYLCGINDKLLIEEFIANNRDVSLMISSQTIESIAKNNHFFVESNNPLGYKKMWQKNALSSQHMLTFYR